MTHLVVVELRVVGHVCVEDAQPEAPGQELLMDRVKEGGGGEGSGGREVFRTGRFAVTLLVVCAQHLQNLVQSLQPTLSRKQPFSRVN